jgi:hypothetical protein
VVPLSSNDLSQFSVASSMKKKKNRKARGQKQDEKPGVPQKDLSRDDQRASDDYGGMDFSNFRKNLGCGG